MKNLLDKLVKLANHKPFKKGFTLTELLVVVLVIGVLAAIALPAYTKSVRKSRVSDALSNLNIVSLKQQDYLLNNEKYAETFKDLNVPIAGMTAEGATASAGSFDYTLDKACIYANSKNESYQLIKNAETQSVGCLSGGDNDFCAMVSDLVPTVSGIDGCDYVAPNDDGGGSGITPDPKDCGSCTKNCPDGTSISGTCNTNTGICDYTGVTCPEVQPEDPEPEGECTGNETKTENNCIYTCSANYWQYSQPAPGYDGYNAEKNRCYKNMCPDPTVQKQTIDGVHYCRTYTKGEWVPKDWTQRCSS